MKSPAQFFIVLLLISLMSACDIGSPLTDFTNIIYDIQPDNSYLFKTDDPGKYSRAYSLSISSEIAEAATEITVDVKKSSGYATAKYGFYFNSESIEDLTYIFKINTDGKYEIYTHDSSFNFTTITALTSDADIESGYGKTNRLSVQEYDSDTSGTSDSIRFLINGSEKTTIAGVLLNGKYGFTTEIGLETQEVFPDSPVETRFLLIQP